MTDTIDVVGAQEAAQILGVELNRISRWAKPSGSKPAKMPPPAADLRASRVWHRKNIEELRDGKPFSKLGKLAIAGLAEAEQMLGVKKRRIGRWRDAGIFPEPALERREFGEPWTPGAGLAATPLWWRRDLTAFKRSASFRSRVAA